MKKSKLAKASEREDGVDMISNLPDHVLLLILSRLQGTEEIIRTSILARQWRYLWTLIPSIDIDYTRALGTLNVLGSNGFKEFVYWVLLHKPLVLDSFRLWCGNYNNMSTIRRWIHAAVMRKVKLLDLMFCPRDESEVIEIPHCLATCGSLEVLRLCLLGYPPSLPKFTGFPALRVLQLTDVDLSRDNVVDYFLKSCPLLEDVVLIDCHATSLVISCPKLKSLTIDTWQPVSYEEESDDDLDFHRGMCLILEICCPKLEFLKLIGHVALEFLFEGLSSLKKAVIHPQELFEGTDDVFHELSHVQSLSISSYCLEMCYDPEVDDPISLPNLKTLEIILDALHMLIPFLTCLPDLEYMSLIIPKKVDGLKKWNKKALAAPEKLRILTCHLKKVEFCDFNEEKPKLDLARFLLAYGTELEEMVFSWGDDAKFHERSMETIDQVSKFYRASSTVKFTAVINAPQPKPTPLLHLHDSTE